MATRRKLIIPYRRKRIGKTNYQLRLKLLLSRKPRLVIRKTNTKIIAQIIQYTPDGDKVIVATDSSRLKNQGWPYSCKNIPAAYLLGYMIANKAAKAKITEAILDLGMQRSIKGSRVYAVIKGALDGGLTIPCNESVFPKQERLDGKHITDYVTKAQGFQFVNVKKQNTDFSTLTKTINDMKTKLIKK